MAERLPPTMMVEGLVAMLRAKRRLATRSFEELVDSGPALPLTGADPALIKQVERVVRGWDRRLPFRTECFVQGLAGRDLLARRGYDAVLHYGSRRGAEGLEAHVWLSSGGRPVLGHRNAHEFTELARFPARR